MIVTITYDENHNPVGWELYGENDAEIKKLGIIRDLTFWGFDNRAIEYNGRKTNPSDPNNNKNPGILSWIQKRFIKH
jgi:hypothetical protein